MRSLRVRLTISYALLVAVLLTAVLTAFTSLVLEFVTRPVVEAVSSSTEKARAIVAAHAADSTRSLQERVIRDAAVPGMVLIIPVGPPSFGVRLGPAGSLPPGPPLARGNRAFHPVMAHRPGGVFEINWRTLLGIHPSYVAMRDGGIIIAPDFRRIDRAVAPYFKGLGIAFLGALVVSWIIGRAITSQAIAPLTRVTEELERFAAGDFSPRPVTTKDRTELGKLIRAYNGAAAQVSAAFRERERVEQHMRRFVADAGHELRTPLTAISGFLEVLEKDESTQSPLRRRAFQTLKKETRRMYGLVERLIALSRLESVDHVVPAEIDVSELVADVIRTLQAAHRRAIRFQPADDAWVWADPAGIHEAVGNLIDNALKYGAGSEVGVEIRRGGDVVEIRVRDGGPGIPEAERSRIFERFYRGDNREAIEGSGLGLAIALRAAKLAGGSIVLESADPGKTVFVLRLPLARSAPGKSPSGRNAPPALPTVTS
jgi:signal transduction histidine kinase